MEQKNNKQLIFFKDLIFTVLYRWKALIIVGLIFALLLGGFAVMNNRKDVSIGGATMTPENLALVEDLETQVAFLKTNIEKLEAYQADSVLMKLDPFAANNGVLQLFVAPENYEEGSYDTTALLIQSYRAYLMDDAAMDAIAEKNGMSTDNFRELRTIYTPAESNYLQISIYGQTPEDVAAYLSDIQACLAAAEEEMDAIAPHTVTFTQFLTGPKVDTGLLDTQNSAITKIKTWQSNLTATETQLKQLKPTALTAAPSNPLVFAVIGAFLGVCIVAVCAWCGYICGSKIYNAKVLENRTGIRILGCIASSKKPFIVDRWLRRLDGRAMHTAPDAVAVNVRNLAKDAKKLLIMGNFQEDALTELTQKLDEAGISCVVCPDPSAKADALNALPECDKVVLVETCGVSRYEAAEWAIQTVEDHEKTLLGCILING